MRYSTKKEILRACRFVQSMPRHEAEDWLLAYQCPVNSFDTDEVVKSKLSQYVEEGIIPANTLLPDDFGAWG